jgi:hypothetical protein
VAQLLPQTSLRVVIRVAASLSCSGEFLSMFVRQIDIVALDDHVLRSLDVAHAGPDQERFGRAGPQRTGTGRRAELGRNNSICAAAWRQRLSQPRAGFHPSKVCRSEGLAGRGRDQSWMR